jgi:hypothetical protein
MKRFTNFLSFSRKLLPAAMLAGCLGSLPAAAQDSTLTRYARQNQYALQASGPQFGGAGWDRLLASVQKSQFVLVGEDHGTAQIPAFTAALAREFKPVVYVAEIDPYVAQALTRLTAQPGPPTAYQRQYPESLCFYDLAEEYKLARSLRAQQARLVGIDQVFITTAAPTYAQLASLVKSQPARAYFTERAATYQRQTQAFEKRSSEEWVMMKQSQAAIDSLLTLTKNESPAARQLAQDYAASYAIYRGGSHQARLSLMKRNLLRELPPGAAAPRMLFKFGAYHVARGLSPAPFGEFYDVGNLVQNLADAQGQTSLHVLVIGKQGTEARGTNPNFPDKNSATYTAADKPKYQNFLALSAGPAWSVFDLRPARRAITAGKLQVSEALRRHILGYDYLVVIPETTASKPM